MMTDRRHLVDNKCLKCTCDPHLQHDCCNSVIDMVSGQNRHKSVHFRDPSARFASSSAAASTSTGIGANYERSTLPRAHMESNVQQLFTFIEKVLSSWVSDDPFCENFSETDEKTLQKHKLKKLMQFRTLRSYEISDIVTQVSLLNSSRFLGNVRFRHFHKKKSVVKCNELFLKKVFLPSLKSFPPPPIITFVSSSQCI